VIFEPILLALMYLWGFSDSATMHSGEKIHIWLRLQVDPDVPVGLHNFKILIDIADLSIHYHSYVRK